MRRDQIEELFYGKTEQQRRFTQDFPVLPDVWIEYGKTPDKRVELLLTPHNESDASRLARALRHRLAADARKPEKSARRSGRGSSDRPRVLFNESVVLASLSFSELLRAAMPLTWWKQVVTPIGGVWVRENLKRFASSLGQQLVKRSSRDPRPVASDPRLLQKLIRIAGCIELQRQGRPVPETSLSESAPSADEIEAFAAAFDRLPPVPPPELGSLWSISVNRRAHTAVWRSRLTVKADAAARLFQAETAGIRWAVLDTGIDARHKAFGRRAGQKLVKPDRTNKKTS